MATQDRMNTSGTSSQAEEELTETATPAVQGSAQDAAQTRGVDDLLDEIDGVLESNAEEFVRGFVQKGGQ